MEFERIAYLCTDPTEVRIPKMAERERDIFVKKISQKLAHAIVRPSAVHQQQTFQVPELSDRIVAGQDGLHSLLAGDADTDVGRLNHGHVVGSVADGQRDRLLHALNQLHHQRLLQRSDAATNHSLALRRHLNES